MIFLDGKLFRGGGEPDDEFVGPWQNRDKV
jgi:hypothetical protein